MNKWEYKKILEVCEFVKGTEPGSNSYNRDGLGVPFIRVGNISAQIQEQVYTTSNNIKICNKEDILIALDGSPGVVIKGVEGAFASGLRKVIIKKPDTVLKEFIYYVLQAEFVQKIIKEYSTGVTIKHASKSLEFIQIPIPPIEIQQKIVRILDTIEKGIDLQKKVIEKTKELKKAVMAELFKYGAPSFRKGKKLKKTEIGEIPEDWQVVKLGEIGIKIKAGGTPNTSKEAYWNGNIAFTLIEDLVNAGKFLTKTNASITEIGLKNSISWVVPENSIILSLYATVGKPVINKIPVAITQNMLGIVPNTKIIQTEFLYYGLEKFQDNLWKHTDLSVHKHITTSEAKKISIPLPPLPEQQEIAEILQTIDQKIEIEQKKKELYEELFKTMLNKIMSGEIDVEKIEI